MDVKFEWHEQRTTTPEGVYRVLRAAILEGSVPPGGQLREAHIASDLGISRSPLREALTRLEEEGLVRDAYIEEVKVSAKRFAKGIQDSVTVAPLLRTYLETAGPYGRRWSSGTGCFRDVGSRATSCET